VSRRLCRVGQHKVQDTQRCSAKGERGGRGGEGRGSVHGEFATLSLHVDGDWASNRFWHLWRFGAAAAAAAVCAFPSCIGCQSE
jgi:hypothetical protein